MNQKLSKDIAINLERFERDNEFKNGSLNEFS